MMLKIISSRFATGSIVSVGLLLWCGLAQATSYHCSTGLLRCHVANSNRFIYKSCCKALGSTNWQTDALCSSISPLKVAPLVDGYPQRSVFGHLTNMSNCGGTSVDNSGTEVPGCKNNSDWECMTVKNASSPLTWEKLKKSEG